ncbi:MAG: hypothetical protein H6737_23915 [Alphaproteobacteria bacterium]|nr:hypothetical protein [Alphaproteobacteria bacterium]
MTLFIALVACTPSQGPDSAIPTPIDTEASGALWTADAPAFPAMYEGTAITVYFTLRNVGTGPLTIDRPQLANVANATVEVGETPDPIELERGRAFNVPLHITPTQAGVVAFDLEIESDDPEMPLLVVPIEGSAGTAARPEVEIDGIPVQSGDVVKVASPAPFSGTFEPQVRVTNAGDAPLSVDLVLTGAVGVTGEIVGIFSVQLPGGSEHAPHVFLTPTSDTWSIDLELEPFGGSPFVVTFVAPAD